MKTGVLSVGDEPPPLTPKTKPNTNKPKRKAGERFGVLNGFVDLTLATLTRSEIAIWLILYRDTKDGIARTSFDDLARRAGCDRRNVSRALQVLESRGLVVVVSRGGFRRGLSTYQVHSLARPP